MRVPLEQSLPRGWVRAVDGWLICYLTDGWAFFVDVPKKSLQYRVYLVHNSQVITRKEDFESFWTLREAIEHCELYKRSGLWKRCPKVKGRLERFETNPAEELRGHEQGEG